MTDESGESVSAVATQATLLAVLRYLAKQDPNARTLIQNEMMMVATHLADGDVTFAQRVRERAQQTFLKRT